MATQSTEVLSKALVTVEPPTDDEIAAIRKKGVSLVAHSREVARIANMLLGTEWGGAASNATRYVVAEFCKVVGAHPVYHIDVLGGKPFLNANYWSDRLNSDERFVDFRWTNISNNAEARAHYGAPAEAKFVYECIVQKLVPFAPIEKIRSGDVTDWRQYVVETPGAGWAGGLGLNKNGKLKDPVGEEHPAKTAQTRSLRRAGARAFAAWMSKYEEQITKAEEALEAEWEEIKPTRRSITAGPQALSSGNGEPLAASAERAQPLPVEDRSNLGKGAEQIPTAQGQAPVEPAAQTDAFSAPAASTPAQPFDATDARKAYFATLRDAGFAGEDGRKAFQKQHKLPESVTTFTQQDYERAMDILVGPTRAQALEGARMLGFGSVEELCASWQIPVPTILRELKELVAAVNAELDKDR